MHKRHDLIGYVGRLLAVVVVLGAAVLYPLSTRAAAGTTLFNLDGNTNTYTDPTGRKTLVGTTAFSNRGTAFGTRLLQPSPAGSGLASFPYGVYGVDETDVNSDMDYTDAGDVDPLALLQALKTDGVYNVAISSNLGQIANTDKIVRTLQGAKDRNIKLIIRPLKMGTGYTLDSAGTLTNLNRLKGVLDADPGLNAAVYALYSYDEPLNKKVPLATLQSAYKLYKQVFPNLPVLTVFNQNQNCADGSDLDLFGECLLGESLNPYPTSGQLKVADIVGLNVYPMLGTSGASYGYNAIGNLYTHARRVVTASDSGVATKTPIWAVAQAHALVGTETNLIEAQMLYRQVNDWMRAGPEAGLPAVQGLLWYHWHFPPASSQNKSDLENSPANRRMAMLIGAKLKTGQMVVHDLPYRPELYLSSAPSSTVKAPTAGHFNLTAGTLTVAFSHAWQGNDNIRHIALRHRCELDAKPYDGGEDADNILRVVVTDSTGEQKWHGLRVDYRGCRGHHAVRIQRHRGDVEQRCAVAVPGLCRGTLFGGDGTGKLTAAGTYLNIGTDLAGQAGAYGTFSYLRIRSGVGTDTEVRTWTTSRTYGNPRSGNIQNIEGSASSALAVCTRGCGQGRWVASPGGRQAVGLMGRRWGEAGRTP
ncbi:MAG: hypothetical protein WKH64_10085 [Chloroflexia bacterium]